MKLTKSKVYDLSILITYSINMIFRENNGNSIIIPKILTYIYQHDIHEHDIQHGINYPKNPNIHLSWQLTSSLAYIIMHIISSLPRQQTTRYHKGRNIDMATSKKHVIAF